MIDRLLASNSRGVTIRLFLIACFALTIQLSGLIFGSTVHNEAIISVFIFMVFALFLFFVVHKQPKTEVFLIMSVNALINFSSIFFLFFNIVTNDTTLKITPLFLVALYSYQQSKIISKNSILYLATIDVIFVLIISISFSSIILNPLSLLMFIMFMVFAPSTLYLWYERKERGLIQAQGEIITRPNFENNVVDFWIQTETGPNWIRWNLPRFSLDKGDLIKAVGVNSGEKVRSGRHNMFLLADNVEMLTKTTSFVV